MALATNTHPDQWRNGTERDLLTAVHLLAEQRKELDNG